MIYLSPILPETTIKAQAFLNVDTMAWNSRQQPLLNHRINPFKPLLTRIEMEAIIAMKEDAKQTTTAVEQSTEQTDQPIAETIDYETFSKIDLRVAKITRAEYVEGADKLLKLQLNIGSETRQVFAGIKSAYTPEQLQDRLVVVVANLKPRKMRFGLSEGMVLAASGNQDIWLIGADSGAEPGARVK